MTVQYFFVYFEDLGSSFVYFVDLGILIVITMATKKELEDQLGAAQEEIAEMKQFMGNLKIQDKNFLYREKKFAKFDGSGDVIDWTSNIFGYVTSRFKDEELKVDYIIDHLDGKAKREIKYRTLDASTSAEDVVQMLIEVFGDKDRAIQVQQEFYSRVQTKEESVEDYAYALTDLVIKMKKLGIKHAYPADQILKERFAEGVIDVNLRRELHRLNLEGSHLKFHQLRRRALTWVDEDKKVEDCKVMEASASIDSMSSGSLQHRLQEQEKKIEQLNKDLSYVKQNKNYNRSYQYSSGQRNEGQYSSGQRNEGKSMGSNTRPQEKPRIICHYCKEPNHVIRDCMLLKQKNRKEAEQQHTTGVKYTAGMKSQMAEYEENDSGND